MKETVIKGNRSIARYKKYKNTGGDIRNSEGYYNVDGKLYRNKEFQFNSNWNWLMPLVKEVLNDSYRENMNQVYDSLHTCDINQVYKTVVEYIDNFK